MGSSAGAIAEDETHHKGENGHSNEDGDREEVKNSGIDEDGGGDNVDQDQNGRPFSSYDSMSDETIVSIAESRNMTLLINIHRQTTIQALMMFDSDPTAKPRFGGEKMLKKDLQAECRKRNLAAHNRLRSENKNQLDKPSGRYCTSWSIIILSDGKSKAISSFYLSRHFLPSLMVSSRWSGSFKNITSFTPI